MLFVLAHEGDLPRQAPTMALTKSAESPQGAGGLFRKRKSNMFNLRS